MRQRRQWRSVRGKGCCCLQYLGRGDDTVGDLFSLAWVPCHAMHRADCTVPHHAAPHRTIMLLLVLLLFLVILVFIIIVIISIIINIYIDIQ